MPSYRRLYRHGGTYFLTAVVHRRRRVLLTPLARRCLRDAIDWVRERWPFVIEELVLLPDHFHIILTLPAGEADFSIRIGRIKSQFTRAYLAAGGAEMEQSDSRAAHGYRGVWQKRFWEHLVRDQDDLGECRRYCWYNPVKHRLVKCPHDWPYSPFHRAIARGWVGRGWCCTCEGDPTQPPVRDIAGSEGD